MSTPAPPVAPALALSARWWTLAQMLCDCLCASLADTVGGPACRCSVVPGISAIADVCERGPGGDGQAWVRFTTTFMTVSYPTPVQVSACSEAGTHAATLELGVLRCAAVTHADGSAPTAVELAADAARVCDDAAAMRRVDCCLPSRFKLMSGIWTPLSGGGCTGGVLPVTVLMAGGALPTARVQEVP